MTRILIIEDNYGIAATVAEHLEAEGYVTEVAQTAGAGLSSALTNPPTVVILDLMLPDQPGELVLRTLRAESSPSAVLILSAKSDEMSKVQGFRVGADDYLCKPFGVLELLARVQNLVERTRRGGVTRDVVRFGPVEVRPTARQVTVQGQPIELRPKAYELLLALLQRPGRVWSRRELLESVWGYDPTIESRTIDWHVAELRRKLEHDPAAPRYLHTVRSVGYRFDYCDD